MSNLTENIQKMISSYELMKAKLIEELRNSIGEAFKKILENAQTFKTISWTQYTDYFNDGEECNFHAHVDSLYIDDEYMPENYKKQIWVSGKPKSGYQPNPNYNQHDGEIIENFGDFLNNIPEEFLKEVFGNHVQITVNINGTFNITDYTDHE